MSMGITVCRDFFLLLMKILYKKKDCVTLIRKRGCAYSVPARYICKALRVILQADGLMNRWYHDCFIEVCSFLFFEEL